MVVDNDYLENEEKEDAFEDEEDLWEDDSGNGDEYGGDNEVVYEQDEEEDETA